MARTGHAYPHASLAAVDLIDVAMAPAPAGIEVADALAVARRRGLRVLALSSRPLFYVLREDLARATQLGLGRLPARAVARRLPSLDASVSEVAVRRACLDGAPFVAVSQRRRLLGLVACPPPSAAPSVASALGRHLGPDLLALLQRVHEIAITQQGRVFLAGGVVRDALRGERRARRDVDVVVEGDGMAVARALAAALGGGLIEHARFQTAAVEAPGVRVDVTTARTERYEAPGALPRVMPATITEDLARRDFAINAMAVELTPGPWELLDPLGGRRDLLRRRLRVLHPLAFVEDPTRLFRAARYGARLGFADDAATVQARVLALRLAPYPELAGQRLLTELARIVDDEHADVALARLGTTGVFRLLAGDYRFTSSTRRVLAELPAAVAWSAGAGLVVSRVELALLAILSDQAAAVAGTALRRLAMTGEPFARLTRLLDDAPRTAAALAQARMPSARARLLRARPPVELAWLWLVAPPARPALARFSRTERAVRPALDGAEVIALGVPAGPAVATVLEGLGGARLDGEIADRAAEIDYVRAWLSARKEG